MTGVQTCALPILCSKPPGRPQPRHRHQQSLNSLRLSPPDRRRRQQLSSRGNPKRQILLRHPSPRKMRSSTSRRPVPWPAPHNHKTTARLMPRKNRLPKQADKKALGNSRKLPSPRHLIGNPPPAHLEQRLKPRSRRHRLGQQPLSQTHNQPAHAPCSMEKQCALIPTGKSRIMSAP